MRSLLAILLLIGAQWAAPARSPNRRLRSRSRRRHRRPAAEAAAPPKPLPAPPQPKSLDQLLEMVREGFEAERAENQRRAEEFQREQRGPGTPARRGARDARTRRGGEPATRGPLQRERARDRHRPGADDRAPRRAGRALRRGAPGGDRPGGPDLGLDDEFRGRLAPGAARSPGSERRAALHGRPRETLVGAAAGDHQTGQSVALPDDGADHRRDAGGARGDSRGPVQRDLQWPLPAVGARRPAAARVGSPAAVPSPRYRRRVRKCHQRITPSWPWTRRGAGCCSR